MRYQNTEQAERKGPPSLGSGGPSLTAISLSLREQKSPEDFSALRVKERIQNLAASATFLTTILVAITAFVAAMVITALIAIVVMPFVTRRDIHDRLATRRGLIHDWCATWHWLIHDDRRAIRHGWRARRLNHNDRTRSVKDWHGQPKHKPDRQPCLGGAGQSDNRNRCNQTEERYSFHGRSDEALATFFNGHEYMHVAVCESVILKEARNE
jgi:hypothetical protein